MRFFPPTWEGLHPAFPQIKLPSETTALDPRVNILSLGLGMSACAGVALRNAFRPKATIHPVPPALRVALFATALNGHASITTAYSDRCMAEQLLPIHGIKVPERQYIDRLRHWDQDNWLVLGALAGLGMGRSMRLLRLRIRCDSFTWSAACGVAGANLAHMFYIAQCLSCLGVKDYVKMKEGEKRKMIGNISYSPSVQRDIMLANITSDRRFVATALQGRIKLSPEIVAELQRRQRGNVLRVLTPFVFGPQSKQQMEEDCCDSQNQVPDKSVDSSQRAETRSEEGRDE